MGVEWWAEAEGEWPARGLYRCVKSDNGVVVLEAVAASGGGRGEAGTEAAVGDV